MPFPAVEDITFGVEIECIANGSLAATADVLRAVGINAATDRYSARNMPGQWLVKPDGSLSHGGREVVSPVLRGAEGLATLRTVVDALAAAGHVADRSCGLHVHIGAAGLTAREAAAVWARYAVMGDEIAATLAPSRRHNYYCNMTPANSGRVQFAAITGTVSIDRLPYALGATGRYAAVNVTPLMRSPEARTIEFRQHQGSVNADRIVNWVRFVRGFAVEAVRLANAPAPTVARGNPFKKTGSQQARLWDAFATGRAMSAADVATLIGTTEDRAQGQINNMRRNAAAHGAPVDIVVRRGRRGAPTTYQFAAAGMPAMVWGDMFDGIDADVAEYMRGRAAHFAGTAIRRAA